jgi:hypothetical protein
MVFLILKNIIFEFILFKKISSEKFLIHLYIQININYSIFWLKIFRRTDTDELLFGSFI